MGVTGLFTQESKIYKSSTKISIINAAEEYRKKFKKQPVILIDGSNFIYGAYEQIRSRNINGGGEIKVAAAVLMQFFNRLKENGIDFQIFFDESVTEERIPIKIKRGYERYKQYQKFFNDLDNGYNPGGTRSANGFSFFVQYCLIAIGKRPVVVKKDADEEIMEYISEHGCFGVISDDSDFMVCDGIPYLFSVRNCNIQTLTTTYTNRRKLASRIPMDPDLLPYFVSLCGNDIVSREDLRDFHVRLRPGSARKQFLPPHEVFGGVADWLKMVHSQCNWNSMATDLANLMGKPSLAPKIEESARFYNLRPKPAVRENVALRAFTSPWDKIVAEAFERVKKGLLDYQAYSIMTKLKLFLGCCLQMYNQPDHPTDVVAHRGMYQRLYGLLLSERPAELGPNVVEETVFTGPRSMDSSLNVQPIFPVQMSLSKLWSNSCEVDTKWRALCWIIDPALDASKVYDIAEPLRVPALAIHLINLKTAGSGSEWVVEALAAQAALLLKATVEDIRNTKCPAETSLSVHYGTVYVNLCTSVYVSSGACGAPIAINDYPDVPFYDVSLFNDACVKIRGGMSGAHIVQQKEADVSNAYRRIIAFLKPC